MKRSHLFMSLVVMAAILQLASCAQNQPAAPAHQATVKVVEVKPPAPAATQPSDYPGLHNVVTFSNGLYSGSVPEGDAGFASLAGMGIRTIISVDGAKPEVDVAKAYGMRYVHLPIGYNGIDKQRTLELARAIRDLPGPIYIHCHHGKHRSAAAAGASAVTLGRMTNSEAIARMKVSGTATSYTGLYACVNVATIAGDALNSANADFPETWKTTGLVNAMVEIDEATEHLKIIEKAGWKATPEHPDLVPVAEAGKLADLLRNLHQDKDVKAKPAEFGQWMEKSSALASSLEQGLAGGSVPPAELSSRFKLISQSCTDCHTKYRN